MVSKNLCVLVHLAKVALALEGLNTGTLFSCGSYVVVPYTTHYRHVLFISYYVIAEFNVLDVQNLL